MKSRLIISSVLILGLNIGLQAKGRRPGEESFDYSRVRRGSPANPTSAFQPPNFNTDYTPTESQDDTSDEPRPSKKPSKKAQKSTAPSEENWTVNGGEAQATPPTPTPDPKSPPPEAAKPALQPATDGIYEPPLPDETQPDLLAPAKKKK